MCTLCGGMGYILFEKDGLSFAKECDCYKQHVMSRRLRFANIPDTFKEMELKTFSTLVYKSDDSRGKINAACRVIKIYLDKFKEMEQAGMGLYLHSKTKGSGKTRMAASISNELIKVHGKQVKFAVSTTILKEIKNTWNRDSECTESRLLDQLSTSDILVIDDFGTEKVADWINDKFYHIINERYINKRITIFTSNESLETLEYDDRITNRMKEVTYQIEFPEESVRNHIAEGNNREMIERIL